MPLSFRKKKVSFGNSSLNTIHHVESYKLESPEEHSRLNDDAEYRDSCLKACEETLWLSTPRKLVSKSQLEMTPRLSPLQPSSPGSLRSPSTPSSRGSLRSLNSLSSSSTTSTTESDCSSITSASKKELFDQQTQAIKNLRLAASSKNSVSVARNQPQENVHARSMCEAEAATPLPSPLPSRRRRRSRRQRRTKEPEMERIRAAVFYNE